MTTIFRLPTQSSRATVVAPLLMTIVPSRQAGNVLPAEALRYE